jgi:hypothetical protein
MDAEKLLDAKRQQRPACETPAPFAPGAVDAGKREGHPGRTRHQHRGDGSAGGDHQAQVRMLEIGSLKSPGRVALVYDQREHSERRPDHKQSKAELSGIDLPCDL